MISALIFYSIFLTIGITTWITWAFIRTSKTRQSTVLLESQLGKEVILRVSDLEVSYYVATGGRDQIAFFQRGNIWLTENCLVFFRRTTFPFTVLSKPIIITGDKNSVEQFQDIEQFEPTKVVFNKSVKDKIEIVLTDNLYNHRKIQIGLKGLSANEKEVLRNNIAWYEKLSV